MLLRGLDLLDVDIDQADVADETFPLHGGDGGELLNARDTGIDAVQLPEVDALDAKEAKAEGHLLAQILRLAAGDPPIGTGPLQAALGGYDDAFVRR